MGLNTGISPKAFRMGGKGGETPPVFPGCHPEKCPIALLTLCNIRWFGVTESEETPDHWPSVPLISESSHEEPHGQNSQLHQVHQGALHCVTQVWVWDDILTRHVW